MTSANPPPEPIDSFAKRFWWGTLALKLALASLVPLFADEAYYWVWGQKLDWSYFDHPPMIGWLFALADLLHLPTSMARWPAILCTHFGLWIWILISRENFPEIDLKKWLWLYLLCPFTGLGGIVMTPDLPLSLFWSLTAFFTFRFWKRGDLSSAVGLGISLGAGFLSKYMIVLFPLSLLPALLHHEVRRRCLSLPMLATLATGALLCTPVLWWNHLHDGLSFSFQLQHGLKTSSLSLAATGDYFLGVALTTLPLIPGVWRSLALDVKTLLLLGPAIFPFVFFALTSLRAPVELNWPMMGLPGLFLAATVAARSLSWGRAYYLSLSVIILFLLVAPPRLNVLEKTREAGQYESLLPVLSEYDPVFASSYQMASTLWFLSQRPVYKLRGSRRFDMYDLWEGSLPAKTQPFYYLRHKDDRWPNEFPATQGRLLREIDNFELWEMQGP